VTHTLSFMSANFVARTLGYHMTRGWGEGDRATQAHFRPLETFGARFKEVLRDVKALGFEAVDLWTGHLNSEWATDAHIMAARDLLEQYDLSVPSLAGWFGSSPDEFEATCKLAAALNIPVLGGSTSVLGEDRSFVVETLGRYCLRLGLENHPEKTPEEMLEKIGDTDRGTVGTAVDTGWYATQGYDAVAAIEALGEHVFHVHLKDEKEVGAHETCRLGEGVVPVERCLEALGRISYTGPIALEHEPELFDPFEDVRASLALVQDWLARRG
jgi:L-ribulose-5-phosphate 3-epimerase